MTGQFRNRREAGRILASKLERYAHHPDVAVLGLPRGGIPVAHEVAKALGVPLDVFVVRKLGVPGQEELAMGAIASGGVRVINEDVVQAMQIPQEVIDAATHHEQQELQRRDRMYRSERALRDVRGMTVILVDDGLATGSTMRAAVAALRQMDPRRIVVGVPVAAASTCQELRREVDEVVCVKNPAHFRAVGLWYEDFSQVSDQEVRDLLERQDDMDNQPVHIPVGSVTLQGDLAVPAKARGIVIFAHGSGSSRHSPRNRFVAGELQAGGIGTLLMDLLTPLEEQEDLHTARLRFDIALLAERLIGATSWLGRQLRTRDLPVGCFGASTGGAAALVAAARLPQVIRAVVSRGGRPDLAGDALPLVQAPTLLIVGGNDTPVIALNKEAMQWMHAPTRLEIIPGATHLFEEPGTLEEVARLAREWFQEHMG